MSTRGDKKCILMGSTKEEGVSCIVDCSVV